MKKLILMTFLVFALAACITAKKIDASNENALQKSIQNMMSDLSPEDQDKFQTSLKLIMFSDVNNIMDLAAMGNNMEVAKGAFMAKVNGKTVDQINEMAATIQAKRTGEEKPVESDHSLASIASQAKSDAVKGALNSSVKVTLKSLKKVRGDYKEYLNISINFENMTDKKIKGVKGVAVFKDMFGDTIKKIGVSSDDSIEAKKIFVYEGSLDLNQFMDEDQKLANTPIDKIDFSFVPEMIIFEDGTTLNAG